MVCYTESLWWTYVAFIPQFQPFSGIQITDIQSAFEAMDIFHAKGVKTVVISSTNLGDDDTLCKEFLFGIIIIVIFGGSAESLT